MNNTPEPSDGKVYYSVVVYRDTFFFLKKAIAFYRELLKKEADGLSLDEELREFISERPEQARIVESELAKVDQMLEFFDERESEHGHQAFEYGLGNLSHGAIRYTKAIGLLYLAHLRIRRNELSKRRNLSIHLLNAIDAELARKEEALNISGTFVDATPVQLLVEQAAPSSQDDSLPVEDKPSLASVSKPKPVLLSTIPILDPTLKGRCLDLFSIFYETSQHDRFDTVLADATRVLEDRMRAILGVSGKTGDELANECFGSISGRTPRLVVSSVVAEQQGVLLLFKGIFSHIRNPVHHRLATGYTPERTLQIIGLIDYAIHVLETATKSAPTNP